MSKLVSRARNTCIFLGAVVIATFLGSPQARAEDNKPPITSVLEGLHLDAGFLNDFRSRRDNAIYYNLEYKGKSLKKIGTKFSDTDATGGADAPELGDDTPALRLRIERGNADLDGGLFDTIGTHGLSGLKFGLLRDLRGTIQASGRLDGKQFNLAAGVETKPIVPLNKLHLNPKGQWTNWIVFGAVAQRSEIDDAIGEDTDSALLTYRAFFGRVVGWEAAAGRQAVVDKEFEAVVSLAPTYEEAVVKDNAIKDVKPKERTDAERRLHAVFGEYKATLNAANYRELVRKYLTEKSEAKELPRNLIWIESTAWYTLTSDLAGSPKRFNNLFALTLQHYLRPAQEDGPYVRLRYENGRERGAPDKPKNQVVLSLGLSLK